MNSFQEHLVKRLKVSMELGERKNLRDALYYWEPQQQLHFSYLVNWFPIPKYLESNFGTGYHFSVKRTK